jgi:hypothetical protein
MTDLERDAAIRRLLDECVAAARHAFSDLTVEQKKIALKQLEAWIAAEEATWLPETEVN